jgi:hypothetical protein
VGTFAFNVDEYSSTNNINFQDSYNTYNIAKFPYDFFVGNFTANTPQVNDGATAILTWIGSDLVTYTMLYDNQPPVDVTNVRSWTTQPLYHDTNFILKASVQSQGETVNTYLSTVVTVTNPVLTATSLTVLQTSALQGDTTVGTAAANVSLEVNGSLSSSGNASVGTLNVSKNANVNGTLNVSQMSSLADTLIQGTLSSSGTVGMLGNAQAVGAGSYYAKTDGFVVGLIMGGTESGALLSMGWIYGINGNNVTMWATGGSNIFWMGNLPGWGNMPNSFLLPVKKGTTWQVNLMLPNPNHNEANPSAYFYWIPIGIGNVADTFEKIADLEPEHIAVPNTAMNKSYPDGSVITAFVDVLENVLQNPKQDNTRELLIEAVSKLFNVPS